MSNFAKHLHKNKTCKVPSGKKRLKRSHQRHTEKWLAQTPWWTEKTYAWWNHLCTTEQQQLLGSPTCRGVNGQCVAIRPQGDGSSGGGGGGCGGRLKGGRREGGLPTAGDGGFRKQLLQLSLHVGLQARYVLQALKGWKGNRTWTGDLQLGHHLWLQARYVLQILKVWKRNKKNLNSRFAAGTSCVT